MPLKLKSIIVLLAIALMIQNTCPFGAAGKSTVASSCEHCPLKHSFIVSPDGQKNITSDSPAVHFPVYVFALPKTIHTFDLEPIKSVRLILADSYKDVLPDELLRPPQA
jgi:hypothetical protein